MSTLQLSDYGVYGKIKSIIRMASSLKKNLIFEYDANGNRIAKHQYGNMTPNSTTINFDPAIPTDWEKSTYYVRDAQGNVMAIYEYTIDDVTQDNHYTLTERNIYGSSRLGNNNAPVEMIANTPPDPSQYSHHIGYRQYELSNHLGNVLAVISDRKIARDTDQDNTVDYYEPDVLLTYDYSPFGAPLHARSFTKEVCDEVTSTQKIEDLNTDFTDGTAQGWQAMGNTALTVNTSGQLKIEKNGGGQLMGATQSFMAISGELYDFTITIDKGSCNSNAAILLEVLDANSTVIYTQTLNSGTQTYATQFTASTSGAYVITVQRINNASNCYFLIDDVLITHEEEVTQTLCEDFAGYRYGFNGQEKDNEISGSGNSYTAEYWQYDPRTVHRWNIDPEYKRFPNWSPYHINFMNPMWFKDPKGNNPEKTVTESSENTNKDVNNLGAPVVNDPEIIFSSKTRIITPQTAAKAFENKTPDDPTFGFIKTGNGYEKIGFTDGFGSQGGGGAYIAVKPTQDEVTFFINQAISIQFNPGTNVVSNATLNEATNAITTSMNAFLNLLPNVGTPERVENAPVNVNVLINTGGNQTIELNNGRQVVQAIEALNNPNIDNVHLMREDQGNYVGSDGSFNILASRPGFILLKISSKINVFGF